MSDKPAPPGPGKVFGYGLAASASILLLLMLFGIGFKSCASDLGDGVADSAMGIRVGKMEFIGFIASIGLVVSLLVALLVSIFKKKDS